MAANTTPEAQKAQPCLCGAYEIEIWDGREIPEGADPGDYVRYEDTNCGAYTTRDFAPGHDAKLKALLIRAGVAGHGVRLNSGGVASVGTAQQHAARFPFAYMVDAGIKRGQAKAASKSSRKSRKAHKPLETPARIKVGRWEYDATIDTATGVAAYTSKGEIKTAQPGKFKIVDAS